MAKMYGGDAAAWSRVISSGERLASNPSYQKLLLDSAELAKRKQLSADAALSAQLEQAFKEIGLTQKADLATGKAAMQGVVKVEPEIAMGLTKAQRSAMGQNMGKPFSNPNIQVLEELWNKAARPGDKAKLNASNSRYLFDLHRNRFWNLVSKSSAARELFENMGCHIEGGAPYYLLNGKKVVVTIDHIAERQSKPELALTASNLQLSPSKENTVFLRLGHQKDPFQKH